MTAAPAPRGLPLLGHGPAFLRDRLGFLERCASLSRDVVALRIGEPTFLGSPDAPVPPPVILWQEEVHKPGIYDLEVDTSLLSPQECAEEIRQRLAEGPPGTAFQQLAERA